MAQTSPCNWEISYAECAEDDCEPLMSSPASGTYETMAVDYLWNWTGKQLGVCGVSLRPCRTLAFMNRGGSTYWGRSRLSSGGFTYTPQLIGGSWYNVACGSCGSACECGSPRSLVLPGPVVEIEEVLIDGEALDPAAYQVQNGRYLIRTDGGRWPTTQDMTKNPDQPGTWQITYTYGVPVPVGGQVAAGVLACELAKAACGDDSCGLPQRVQEITRQGYSVAVLDSFEDIDKGHTGIWLIDSWVASLTKSPRASRVYSPDVPRTGSFRRKSWP